ncbi:PHP domain-containing protein [Halocatena pleomorpha]|uniref:PHP domain-containing protein n=1 Tax=Halocatena pleomorpha TaxID=1785090 RepID=A0A3P3REW9_9EURY|nr:PHP domain-containing protein [Halocatena pleomorpha]RRJ31290.1 PHP domain-containing protein [Halocatena pleomorpha]
MVVADLHVHTTNSDGELEPDAVPQAAAMDGVSVVAITDHDRFAPSLDAPVTEIDGVTVIHGIELRVEEDGQQIDLLGYGVRPTAALRAEVNRLQEDRIERAKEIVERVERRTGVALDLDLQPGVGRPHVARAIERSAIDCDYHAAFDQLIGDDCPCFVPRSVPSFERGRALLADACGLVSLAHPLRYDDRERALSVTAALDGVEYHYDYGRDVDLRPVERTIRENDLVVTGGSDAHDRTLGRAGLSAAEYGKFRERCRRN